MYDEGCAVLIAENYGDQTDFGNYKTLFTIGSSSGLPYYASAVESGEQGEFQWGVAPLAVHGWRRRAGHEPVWGQRDRAQDHARAGTGGVALCQVVHRARAEQVRWAMISNYFPVRHSAAALMADYLAENPTYKQAFDLLPYSTYEAQWCACYEDVRRLMSDAYSAILDGADINETLAQLEVDANESLADTEPPKPAEPTPTPTPVPAGPYEDVDPTGAQVLWWHQHSGGRQEGLDEMVAEFNASNEWGIEVVAEFAGGYGDIYDKMINAIAADDPTLMPNLTVGYANQVAKYQLSDALVDMDYFVDSPKWGLTAEEVADFPARHL